MVEEHVIKQLSDGITKLGDKFEEFGNRLTRIETMFSMFERSQNDLYDKVNRVETTALDAQAAARTEMINGLSISARVDKLEKIVFWGGTSIIGAVIVAGMAIIIKGVQS